MPSKMFGGRNGVYGWIFDFFRDCIIMYFCRYGKNVRKDMII